jgi:hypothetical protein
MLFPVMYVIARIIIKVPPVRAMDMDFVTDIEEIEKAM